ncbi:MAG: protocatechuate 3,4-dioxygenase subunit alpha [Pseudomonadota bacterium]
MHASRNLRETPSQTAGPYVHIGLAPGAAGLGFSWREVGSEIAGPGAAGERIRIEGQVLDGLGAPVTDALLEIWQANAAGIYAHPEDPRQGGVEPDFQGWGRVATDFETGLFAIETVKPGAVTRQGDAPMAPHLTIWLVARGISMGLHTRLYFADEQAANATDPVLARVPPERRETLIAARPDAAALYRFDIRLQGEDETVFFDI